MREIPKKYNHVDSENRWITAWDEWGTYSWVEDKPREKTFIVDTPPPTVSGSLHVGHVFSYTQTDLVVRYQRMRGKNIMYPMGWDDNGLPTERRVQNKFGIRCNPHLPYDEKWQPIQASEKNNDSVEVSRQNFIEACAKVTTEDEAAFEDLWKRLGLSVDWSQTYATIDDNCREASQLSFLDLVEKGLIYSAESPTMWDVGFQTALAQADLEDRVIKGAYHDLRFAVEGGDEFIISTTRPELLVSCIAVAAHPEDERYQKYFGSYAVTPLFHARVPIVAAEHADPEKGTGILMICTFGDICDVDWWKSSGQPVKQVLSKDGRFVDVEFTSGAFESLEPEKAQQAYAELSGKSVVQGRKAIVELLSAPGSAVNGDGAAMIGAPKPIEHPVKFYEKGENPIEFVTTRQWFVSVLEHKEQLLEQGRKIKWHPEHMRTRYEHWVDGLNHDWCISRQRFFGVPFPVWYPVKEDETADYANPIWASADQLPVDPLSQAPQGYEESQRGKPGGFVGDPDVMDTWATSSLSPEIVSHWGKDPKRHEQLFPMDVRPQSHEIIRTWAFYTIVKAWMHFDDIPWKNVLISGWILDPDRKKMSKSKGNVVTPQHLLNQYSSDAVRYWAARARLGVDTAFDEKVFKSGQKLATKVFNASRFALMQISSYLENNAELPSPKDITQELDRAFVSRMRETIARATEAFDSFDYAGALQITETSFWYFCDHYLELVKGRIYSDDDVAGQRSGVATLAWSVDVFLRAFAPFLPYVTEEVWSCFFQEKSGDKSVHRASWPCISEIAVVEEARDVSVLETVVEVVEGVRHAKSEERKTLKWPVENLEIIGPEEVLESLRLVLDDIEKVGRVVEDGILLTVGSVEQGKKVDIKVELAQEMAS
jgi:valyl-tRNA synthetase